MLDSLKYTEDLSTSTQILKSVYDPGHYFKGML